MAPFSDVMQFLDVFALVLIWKFGHYFYELLFVFMRQFGGYWKNVLRFYVKMNSDPEVDAPFALENLDMI